MNPMPGLTEITREIFALHVLKFSLIINFVHFAGTNFRKYTKIQLSNGNTFAGREFSSKIYRSLLVVVY